MYIEDYDIPVGFLDQPDDGSCGVYALAHLMNLLGSPSYIDDAELYTNFRSKSDSFKKHFNIYDAIFNYKWTKTKILSGYGVKENGMISAVKKLGWKPTPFKTLSEIEAQEFMEQKLRTNSPILLKVNYSKTFNDGGHWFVCGGINKDKYIIIDSESIASNKGILSLYSWEDLYRRNTWYNDEGKYFQFNAISVESNNGINLMPRLSKHLGILQKNLTLQYWWGLYLSDLVDIFEVKQKAKNPYSAEDFFNKYSVIIKENVSYWIDEFETTSIIQELNNYRVVAMAYNMSFEQEKLEQVLVGFTTALIGTLYYYQ